MDESKSPAKLGRLSQSRGSKPSSKDKSNKDAHVQREETTTRRQGNLNASKEEHNTGPGKMRGRSSRLTRLTGRTNVGESSKGKAGVCHQQQVAEAPDSPGSHSTDSSPSTTRESSSPVVPGRAETGLRTWGGWRGRLALTGIIGVLSAGLNSGLLVCRSVEEEAEERPTMEEASITEQQLGLRQAEERLYRDYIHRLLKVREAAPAPRRVIVCIRLWFTASLPPVCLQQSPEYPNYQYLCKLCSVHIENIQGAHKHIKEKRHKKNITVGTFEPLLPQNSAPFISWAVLHQEKQEENELRALPPASAAHLRALDASIRRTARQNGVSQEDFQVRKAVVARMEELIRRHLPACSLRLYGSTLTQFAFKSSDINVDVRHPPSVGLLL